MKKSIAVLLILTMIVSVMPVAFAADSEALSAANCLNELGLFDGTGTTADGKPIYELDRAPTRHEAVTMLVRLLGKEDEALAGTWETPFTDVADWAKPYVGYAYANGLTSGTSATTYSGSNTVTASQYITFVLRALGYDSDTDFRWDKAWELSDEIGLTDGRYNAQTTEFLRGDVAIISYNSLSCEKKVDIFANIPEETATQKSNYELMMTYWDRRFGFPKDSRGLTLTWDKARALVGQDIETVKKYVRTLEDCLYYLCASDHRQVSGDLRYRDPANDEIQWHFNYSPQVVFERNEGNCGGNAGLVACLLEGDYEEIGFACKRSRLGDGGHVINYLKDGDVYYTFDVNQFVGGYDHGLYLQTSTDLNEAVKKSFRIGDPENERPAMMAYTYTGCWSGDSPQGWPYEPTSYIIEGYAEKVNIVYETPEEGYVYKFIEVSQETLDKIEEIRNQK